MHMMPSQPEVEHAGALVEHLAQGRQQQRHRERHAQRQDVVEQKPWVTAGLPAWQTPERICALRRPNNLAARSWA